MFGGGDGGFLLLSRHGQENEGLLALGAGAGAGAGAGSGAGWPRLKFRLRNDSESWVASWQGSGQLAGGAGDGH